MKLWAGTHDPLSARIAARLGYDGIWLGGYGLSASMLGLPDAGFLQPEHYLDALARIRAVCDLPIIIDAEGGHGRDLAGIAELGRSYAAAGASVICIEDTTGPKRSSLWTGYRKTLRPMAEMAEVISSLASSGARVIGRTEALILGLGVDEAVRRVDAYAEAGAWAQLPHFKDSVEDVLTVGRLRGAERRLVIIPTRAPSHAVEELADAGFSIAIASNVAIRSAARGMSEALEAFTRTRRLAHAFEKCLSIDELDRILERDRLVSH